MTHTTFKEQFLYSTGDALMELVPNAVRGPKRMFNIFNHWEQSVQRLETLSTSVPELREVSWPAEFWAELLDNRTDVELALPSVPPPLVEAVTVWLQKIDDLYKKLTVADDLAIQFADRGAAEEWWRTRSPARGAIRRWMERAASQGA